MGDVIRVTVWHEYRQEKTNEEMAKLYPDGLHKTLAACFNAMPGIKAGTATLDEPEHGLTEEVLAKTDVLTWWGHVAHGEVTDEIVDRVQKRVLEGMGLIVMHSAHFSKIFRRMIGTSGRLKWREIGEKERLWCVNPSHPIARGVGECVEIEHEEMYGEPFGIPEPDELVFVGWFQGGEVFRSGCCFNRGNGKVFYFQPGHETYPVYHNPEIQKILGNAIRWAACEGPKGILDCEHVGEPPEKVG